MANIYDIAKESGVSRSTVSRVINNQPSVSDLKRQKVLAAIEKLKYIPSAMARALASSRTNTIGVISRELAHSFYNEFIKSIHFGADARNYGVIYTMRNAFMQTNINYGTLLHKLVDGYVFIGEGTITKDEVEDFGHNDIPVVGYEFHYDTPNGLYININNVRCGYDVVAYLNDLKHKNIIHVTYKNSFQELILREQGFMDGVKEFDIRSAEVFRVGFDLDEIYLQCQDLLNYIQLHQITAAFCANNVIASVLIEVLIKEGYQVPIDFSVVGFDDTPVERPQFMNRQKIPEITSMKQPQSLMASYGVNALITAIEKDQPLETGNKLFDCEMIIRSSTSIRSA